MDLATINTSNPPDWGWRALFQDVVSNPSISMLSQRNWAVVGNHGKNPVAYRIVNKLQEKGKRVFRVNPSEQLSEQVDVLPSLQSITEEIDVVLLIVNPIKGLSIVQEMANLEIKQLWIQPGASSPNILDLAKQYNLMVYEGCVMIEYQ